MGNGKRKKPKYIKERTSTEKKNTHKISNRNRASEHAILKSSDWKTHSLCLTGIKRFLKKEKNEILMKENV